MEDHFSRLLGGAEGATVSPAFLASKTFAGGKPGYVFKNGDRGIGYYLDDFSSQNTAARGQSSTESVTRKRKLEPDIDRGNGSRESDIEKLLEEADNTVVTSYNASTLKQVLVNFEKKINKNQMMRAKFGDSPEKFMESEIELNMEISELYALAASPELYPVLVGSGSLESLLGLIAHENTDISISVVGLLQELTEPTTLQETEDAIGLVDAIVALQGLELLVQNLTRLDEKNEEDITGVYNTLAIIENTVSVKPEIAVALCARTHIFTFLIERLSAKTFDSNKLYSSEIFCILLQADFANVKRVTEDGAVRDMDVIDALLQILFQYRKKEDLLSDEEECVHNLFDSMCTLLRHPAVQKRFLELEGLELMVKCLKELKYAAICALKVILYAITDNKVNAERFIFVGGLKFVFPMLFGRGLPKVMVSGKKKSRSAEEKQETEEDILGIISQMCILLHDSKEHDSSTRLLAKFFEADFEKLDHCVELFVKYSRQLKATEYQIESIELAALRAQMEELGQIEEEDEEDKLEAEEFRYAKRLEGGLQSLQQISVIIAFAAVYGGREIFERIAEKLRLDKLSFEDIQNILRENASALMTKTPKESGTQTLVLPGFEGGVRLLIEWSAVIGQMRVTMSSSF